MTLLTERFKRHLKKGEATQLGSTTLQTWWVVEKCVESPESDRVFCHVVGVLRRKKEGLSKQYRQTSVLVLTEKVSSRVGIAVNWKSQFGMSMHALAISSIDYEYSVFPGWD